MAATFTTFAYDAVAGVPSYTSANAIDWMNQVNGRPAGVIPGEDLGLVCTSDGLGNILTQNGVCILGGRIAVLTGGPATTAIPSLPASGFRTAYAVVVRFNTSTQTTSVVIIAGSTIANPGPAVNPSIVSATDTLLAYVLVVNTGGTNAYTVTDARTFTDVNILAITGTTTYAKSDLGPRANIFATLSGSATVDISAGSIYQGATCFLKNASAAPQTLTFRIRAGGTGTGYDLTILQNEWVNLKWDGTYWLIIGEGFSTNKIVVLTSGTTYTVEAGRTRMKATTIGGGGGGAGGGGGGGTTTSNGTGGGNGGTGGNTTMTGATTGTGGSLGKGGRGGQGIGSTPAAVGGGGGGSFFASSAGSGGIPGETGANGAGGAGGLGGVPQRSVYPFGSSTWYGSGGQGGDGGAGGAGGGGGGGGSGQAGGSATSILSVTPGQTISYAIGGGGTAGSSGAAGTGATAGTAGNTGTAGAIVIEY